MASSFYKYHVFVCTNQRELYSACGDFNTQSTRDYMKQELTKRDKHGEGQVRIGQAGCLGRCPSGPVMVIYPQGTWYSFVDQQDIDEIIESHLMNDQIVERLLVDAAAD